MKNRPFAKTLYVSLILIISLLCSCDSKSEVDDNKVTPTTAELELYNEIMNYRNGLGLDDIPLSSSLTFVAQKHVSDLEENNPITASCNIHSWSDQGNWTACCYTSDHAQADCMWNKPRELTDYIGNGYEIASLSSENITPLAALNSFKQSMAVNNVITNGGNWTTQWMAIGVGIKGKYAVVWFGNEEDPAGQLN